MSKPSLDCFNEEDNDIETAILEKHRQISDKHGYGTNPFTLLAFLNANGFLNTRKLKKAYRKGELV